MRRQIAHGGVDELRGRLRRQGRLRQARAEGVGDSQRRVMDVARVQGEAVVGFRAGQRRRGLIA